MNPYPVGSLRGSSRPPRPIPANAPASGLETTTVSSLLIPNVRKRFAPQPPRWSPLDRKSGALSDRYRHGGCHRRSRKPDYCLKVARRYHGFGGAAWPPTVSIRPEPSLASVAAFCPRTACDAFSREFEMAGIRQDKSHRFLVQGKQSSTPRSAALRRLAVAPYLTYFAWDIL
jgi:hypothetical protein